MAERLILCIGTKKGLFIAESAKTRRKFELRGPFRPGVECLLGPDRPARRKAENLRLQLLPILRNENPSLD
jgi:hypothetical protein